jgi:hypothetical protein
VTEAAVILERMIATADRAIAQLDRILATQEACSAILERLDHRPLDVPLHQPGLGVMDKPPA